MRVLMLSKALVVGIYQRKLEEMAAHGVDLLALVPPSWRDERGETPLERVSTEGYQLQTTPIRFNGNFHLHHYPDIGTHIRRFQPEVVHIDEEPYNAATWHALHHARRAGARTVVFSWQNIPRRYPPPFRWGEAWTLRNVDTLIAGTESAVDVWREKGYSGATHVVPQFGIDPDVFTPDGREATEVFTVGYVGRLVEEKGVHLLLDALADLKNPAWRLRLIGDGPYRSQLATQAQQLGVADKVAFVGQLPSVQMPAEYRKLNALVLPSLTRPNWKEQFGRALIEAMASGVPVVGSDSGAIPDVIGDGGLVFEEGRVESLCKHLNELQNEPRLTRTLESMGRKRVLEHFTHAQVAADTVAVYRTLLPKTVDSTRIPSP